MNATQRTELLLSRENDRVNDALDALDHDCKTLIQRLEYARQQIALAKLREPCCFPSNGICGGLANEVDMGCAKVNERFAGLKTAQYLAKHLTTVEG